MVATWSVHDQTRDQCMISHVISVWSSTWSVHDQARDQCMISYVISAWSLTWPVYGSYVIIAWTAAWAVHDSHVISAWSVTWSVYDHPGDPCMGSHEISDILTPFRDRKSTRRTKANLGGFWVSLIVLIALSWQLYDAEAREQLSFLLSIKYKAQ